MSLRRIAKLLRKDFALGPRSMPFMYMIILPIILTIVFQFAFGDLFAPKPRLGIVDAGDSAVTQAIAEMDGIELTRPEDAQTLRELVEANDLDVGFVLPADFDEMVRAGEQPPLDFWISGESLASNRVILAVTALDSIRGIEERPPPVDVRVVSFGEEGLPIGVRLIPVIVFYALVISGVFVPSSSLVEEKEAGTLSAVLVTPVTLSEILVSKWIFGVTLATAMSGMTLLLNGALGPQPLEVMVVLLVGAMLVSTIGLLVAVIAKDATMMFAIIKGAGILLFAPAIFYIFPEWPQWIAKLFPLYWVIEPIWQVSIMGDSIAGVWMELGVALAIAAGLMVVTLVLAKRLRASLTGSQVR